MAVEGEEVMGVAVVAVKVDAAIPVLIIVPVVVMALAGGDAKLPVEEVVKELP